MRDGSEVVNSGLTYSAAIKKFRFYVDAVLEFSMDNVRAVNILSGNKCLKLFQNH